MHDSAQARLGPVSCLVVACFAASAPAQSGFGPAALQTSLNSPASDTNPCLATDLLSVCFDSQRAGGAGGADLYAATRTHAGSVWSPPAAIAGLNTAANESAPFMAPDGLTIYFASNRAGSANGPGGTPSLDVWQSTRAAAGQPWGPPTPVAGLNAGSDETQFCMTADGLECFLLSNGFGNPNGNRAICRSTRAAPGQPWSTPTLVAELDDGNTHRDCDVSDDGLRLVYTKVSPTTSRAHAFEAFRPSRSAPFGAPIAWAEFDAVGPSQGVLAVALSPRRDEALLAAGFGAMGGIELLRARRTVSTGSGCPAGQPLRLASTPPTLSETWRLTTTNVDPLSPIAFAFFGAAGADVPIDFLGAPGCSIHVDQTIATLTSPAAAGVASLSVVVPNTTALAGVGLHVQSACFTLANSLWLHFSNGRLCVLSGASAFGAETAADFTVWGAAWTRTAAQRAAARPSSVVRMAQMGRTDGPTGRLRQNGFTTLQPIDLANFVADCHGLPPGRVVMQPEFLTDAALGGNDLGNYLAWRDTAQGTSYAGQNWDTPFVGPSSPSVVEATTAIAQLLAHAEANGIEINYVCDDQEQFRRWKMNSFQNTGGTPNWTSPADTRHVQAIVFDPRYATYTTPFAGGAFSIPTIVRIVAGALDGADYSARTDPQMVGYWLYDSAAYTTLRQPADWGQPYQAGLYPGVTPGNQTSWYAWDAAINGIFCEARKAVAAQLLAKPYFRGWDNYDTFGTYDLPRSVLLREANSHRSLTNLSMSRDGLQQDVVLYGEIGALWNNGWGALPTAATDAERYAWQPSGPGIVRPSSAPHCGFLFDLQKLRAAAADDHRLATEVGDPEANAREMASWVCNPADAINSTFSSYAQDARYLTEAMCHAAVCGVTRFWHFLPGNSSVLDSGFLHDFLVAYRDVSGNSRIVPTNNPAGSPQGLQRNLELGAAMALGAISGGKLVSGPKAGVRLWRVSVPTGPAYEGPGGTRVTFSSPAGLVVDVPTSARGFWVETAAARPVIASTSPL